MRSEAVKTAGTLWFTVMGGWLRYCRVALLFTVGGDSDTRPCFVIYIVNVVIIVVA
jgi:hypothetical protein